MQVIKHSERFYKFKTIPEKSVYWDLLTEQYAAKRAEKLKQRGELPRHYGNKD